MWSELYIYRSACKALVILVKFNDNWNLSKDFRKILKFHENACCESRVGPMGRTDRRTDITKLIYAFQNFANAPKNYKFVFNTIIWITRGVELPFPSSVSLTFYSLGPNDQHCFSQYLLNPSPCLPYVLTVHCTEVPRQMRPHKLR